MKKKMFSPERVVGREAQRMNIMAARMVGEMVRTTLGPKGMDKMIVSKEGVIVTNDGVTILNEMKIEHPVASMIVDVARTQEKEVGDGTTTAVILASEMLKNAERLLDKEVHPTIIAKGYRLAAEKSKDILRKLARKADDGGLKSVALTAMTGKGAEDEKELLSGIAVEAVKSVRDREGIKLIKITGSSVADSRLLKGIVIDKEKLHPGMPDVIKNAKIAIVSSPIEVKGTDISSRISIDTPDKLQEFIELEEKILRDSVNRIVDSGANLLICQKGIDDRVQHLLAESGVMAFRRVMRKDIEMLSKATGAKIVSKCDDLNPDVLGRAGVAEMIRDDDNEMLYIKECAEPRAVTVIIRGGTEHVVDEVARALEDAIGDLISALDSGSVLPGAGATEIAVAKSLMEYSEKLSGREQLAVKAFAEALEVIPATLAENAGIDPIDAIIRLKSDGGTCGIDLFSGGVVNSWESGIIEPYKVKEQAISSAADVAVMILRIDDVIASENLSEEKTSTHL